jgi:protein-disulfide isomerase
VNAARAARCAGEKDRFWEMRSALFGSAGVLDVDVLVDLGKGLGLDEGWLRACIASDRHDADIRRDMDQAAQARVHGTPSFVLGRTEGEGVRGIRFAGAQPYEAYETRIRAQLGAEAQITSK